MSAKTGTPAARQGSEGHTRFARVRGMSHNPNQAGFNDEVDPAGTTEQFRAFVNSGPSESAPPSNNSNTLVIAGVALVAVALVVIVALVLL